MWGKKRVTTKHNKGYSKRAWYWFLNLCAWLTQMHQMSHYFMRLPKAIRKDHTCIHMNIALYISGHYGRANIAVKLAQTRCESPPWGQITKPFTDRADVTRVPSCSWSVWAHEEWKQYKMYGDLLSWLHMLLRNNEGKPHLQDVCEKSALISCVAHERDQQTWLYINPIQY